jgi:hypothetical protein
MPEYEVRERHETRVAAPAEATWTAARALDLERSPAVRAVFAGRELLMRARRSRRDPSGGFLAQVLALGWRVLAEQPGRELVLGAVTQPWQADVVFRGLEPAEFAAFDEPGYAKIAWTLRGRGRIPVQHRNQGPHHRRRVPPTVPPLLVGLLARHPADPLRVAAVGEARGGTRGLSVLKPPRDPSVGRRRTAHHPANTLVHD